jgi:hypothetical protein
MTRKLIDQALYFDAIGDAEKKLGCKLEESPYGLAAGLISVHSRANTVRRFMDQSGDVHNRLSYEDYCNKVLEWGFNLIFEDEFLNREGKTNYQKIFWLPEGVLLVTDSYFWSLDYMPLYTVNTATMYYNVQITKEQLKTFFKFTSSGCCEIYDTDKDDYVWCGDHNVREALKHKLDGLKSSGSLLSQWRVAPFMCLNHYGERKERPEGAANKDFVKLLNEELFDKIAKFPDDLANMLRQAIKSRENSRK